MLSAFQFTKEVIRPTLKILDPFIPYSKDAEMLLLGTALQESRLTFLRQLGGGPALGIFQMEPETFKDILKNWVYHRKDFNTHLGNWFLPRGRTTFDASQLIYDLRFACAMARIHYYRKPGAIPTTVPGQAGYWKTNYNTITGKGSAEEYIQIWHDTFGHMNFPSGFLED